MGVKLKFYNNIKENAEIKKIQNSFDDAGTLIHEAIHAKSGLDDVDRRFEHELTIAIGQVSEKALKKNRKWWQ